MIGTGSAGIDITLFGEYAADTPQRQIAGDAGAGDPAANDEYLCIQS
jgi:hypothetical protein